MFGVESSRNGKHGLQQKPCRVYAPVAAATEKTSTSMLTSEEARLERACVWLFGSRVVIMRLKRVPEVYKNLPSRWLVGSMVGSLGGFVGSGWALLQTGAPMMEPHLAMLVYPQRRLPMSPQGHHLGGCCQRRARATVGSMVHQ